MHRSDEVGTLEPGKLAERPCDRVDAGKRDDPDKREGSDARLEEWPFCPDGLEVFRRWQAGDY